MPDEAPFEFDVFISFSSKDEAWVRGELMPRIERAGLTVFVYGRDFTPGAASVKEMTRGVEKCRKTLAVLTPDYLHSEWCKSEFEMAATLGLSTGELRVIPLLKSRCEKPLHIRTLTHINFADGADHDIAWRQLLTSLGKPPEPEPPQEPQRDQWFLAHPYPMPPNFTGRVAERAMLDSWLAEDAAHPLLSLRALGGFGKSALVWHWLTHDVTPDAWPRVVWWSFYEPNATFDRFLVKTLHYLSNGKIQLQRPTSDDVEKLWMLLRESGILLVLDGFERELRVFGGLDAAYQGDEARPSTRDTQPSTLSDHDCVSPLADMFLRHVALQPHLRSKVLLTTRLCPRVLEAKGGGVLNGARDEQLLQMQPADAVAFFGAQGIRGTHTEIETACAPYGYHPLSLRLLAGLIVSDFQQPGDIAAAKRLDVSGDLVQRQHHVLETAYDSLAPSRGALLGRIACFRSPVSYDALRKIGEREVNARTPGRKGAKKRKRKGQAKVSAPLRPGDFALNLDADLRDLVSRGLLHHDTRERRFDLHPIVRRYAYDRLAAPDRAAAHRQLRDYFAAVPATDKVTRLEDLTPVIELYHHTVRAGQFDEACMLLGNRLVPNPLHFRFGAYQLMIELKRALFPDGENRPPRLKDERDQSWALNALASSYSLSGQPRRALPLYERKNVIREGKGDKTDLAIGLNAVACAVLLPIGQLRAAEGSLRRSIALCCEINDEMWEAAGHQELGNLLAYCGADAELETELATALAMLETQNNVQGQGVNWVYRALRELLRLRTAANRKSDIPDLKSPLVAARRALELADEDARTDDPVERDYVHAHWMLGAAYRVAGQTDEAERHLHEALERCRRINLVEFEADILIDLARLRAATGVADEALRLAEEARVIAERSGYVLQGADAHLELAKLALARGDKVTAKEHAEEAHRLATCDGPPDYTYHAAYTEAGLLLRQIANLK